MKTIELPQLYATTSTGATKVWKIRVEELPDGSAKITMTYGLLGGKLQEKVEIVKEGKNLGRSNETTPWEQAQDQAEASHLKKLNKKYHPEEVAAPTADEILLPMLALNFKKRGHDIVFPAFIQRKFNGVRCLAKRISATEIRFTTRGFKPFPDGVCDHLVKPLLDIMRVGQVLDGEFYHHDWTFQQLCRTVKKARDWREDLQYHVFDVVDQSLFFADRLRLFGPNNGGPVQFVETRQIASTKEVKHWHDIFVREGYEGIIIRNSQGPYVMDHRSRHLQKYKEFQDAEFKIVGGTAEVLTDPVTHTQIRAVVFTCQTSSGGTFNVRPRGSVAARVRMFDRLEELKGSLLTVRYQELSEGGIPIFPVGIVVRDYE